MTNQYLLGHYNYSNNDLAGKAASSHNHTTAQITNFDNRVKAVKVNNSATSDYSKAVPWSGVSGKTNATSATAGLMTAADKKALDSLDEIKELRSYTLSTQEKIEYNIDFSSSLGKHGLILARSFFSYDYKGNSQSLIIFFNGRLTNINGMYDFTVGLCAISQGSSLGKFYLQSSTNMGTVTLYLYSILKK